MRGLAFDTTLVGPGSASARIRVSDEKDATEQVSAITILMGIVAMALPPARRRRIHSPDPYRIARALQHRNDTTLIIH
jgi:hypothetical protein